MTLDTTTPPTRPAARSGTGRKILALLAVVIAFVAILFFTGPLKPRPNIAIVTGGQTPYWDQVLRGASDAAERHKVNLIKITPPSTAPAQTQALRELLDEDLDGVAVSVLEPITQAEALAELAAAVPLVTFDSDSPVARRLCFVGTDNYEA